MFIDILKKIDEGKKLKKKISRPEKNLKKKFFLNFFNFPTVPNYFLKKWTKMKNVKFRKKIIFFIKVEKKISFFQKYQKFLNELSLFEQFSKFQ